MGMIDPQISYRKNGSCYIKHREYFNELVGSTNFKVDSYFLNPSNRNVFPWLSVISTRFESYLFSKLNFMFETEAPTSSTGTVIIAIDYDTNDPEPTSKLDALSYDESVRTAPWNACKHICKLGNLRKQKTYYTSQVERDLLTGIPNSARLSEMGRLYVCRQGQADSTSIIGELWVEYEIELMTPQLALPQNIATVFETKTGSTPARIIGTDAVYFNPLIRMNIAVTSSSGLLRFSQYWSGILILDVAGTVISGEVTLGNNSLVSIVRSENNVVNAAGTACREVFWLNIQPGGTILPSITATTVTDLTVTLAYIPFLYSP